MKQIAFRLGEFAKKFEVYNPFTGEVVALNWDVIKVKNTCVEDISVSEMD